MKGQLRLANGTKLESPFSQAARPTTALVREALMNTLRDRIKNSNWLDLFSGSGIVGCEAINEGAKGVVAIELNKKIYKACKTNLSKVALASQKEVFLKVINTEANKFLNDSITIWDISKSTLSVSP